MSGSKQQQNPATESSIPKEKDMGGKSSRNLSEGHQAAQKDTKPGRATSPCATNTQQNQGNTPWRGKHNRSRGRATSQCATNTQQNQGNTPVRDKDTPSRDDQKRTRATSPCATNTQQNQGTTPERDRDTPSRDDQNIERATTPCATNTQQNQGNTPVRDRDTPSLDNQHRGRATSSCATNTQQNQENTPGRDIDTPSRDDQNEGSPIHRKNTQQTQNTQPRTDSDNRPRDNQYRGSPTHRENTQQTQNTQPRTDSDNHPRDNQYRDMSLKDDDISLSTKNLREKKADFQDWIQKHKLERQIVRRLEEEDLDDIQNLMEFPQNQIGTLRLTSDHKKAFIKALNALKNEDICNSNKAGSSTAAAYDSKDNIQPQEDTYGKAFENLLREFLLNKQTIYKLENFGIDCPEALAALDNENIDILHLSETQRCILEDVRANLKINDKDQAFYQWLQDKIGDQPTIDKLISLGIDCPEALVRLDEEVIDKLQLPLNPKSFLNDVIANLNTSGKGSEPIGVMKQLTNSDGAELGTVEFRNAIDRFKNNTSDVIKPGFANAATYLQSNMGKRRLEIPRFTNEKTLVKLPVQQVYEDHKGKVRKCILGQRSSKDRQKTVMLVGATGVGKSSLIDGMCNYIFGVKQQEKNRFQLIDQHKEETQNAAKGQTVSQTEWITIYTIYTGQTNKLPYTLNVIDTPGFGDTRGITRDQKIVEQIKFLFENREDEIDEIDAICFVAKAPDARLTPTQRYIYQSISTVFGKDIEFNILAMITFADAGKPPVLKAIKDARLTYIKEFTFNNSALLANFDEANEFTAKFGKMFWNMGMQSFQTFFDFLETLTPKSLCLTREDIEQRQDLKKSLSDLEHEVHQCLANMALLKGDEEIFLSDLKNVKPRNDSYSTQTYLSEEEEQINDNIKNTKGKYDQIEIKCIANIKKSHEITKRLENIAPKPEALTELEYIEKLIESEKFRRNDGWRQRVQQLEEIKQKF